MAMDFYILALVCEKDKTMKKYFYPQIWPQVCGQVTYEDKSCESGIMYEYKHAMYDVIIEATHRYLLAKLLEVLSPFTSCEAI